MNSVTQAQTFLAGASHKQTSEFYRLGWEQLVAEARTPWSSANVGPNTTQDQLRAIKATLPWLLPSLGNNKRKPTRQEPIYTALIADLDDVSDLRSVSDVDRALSAKLPELEGAARVFYSTVSHMLKGPRWRVVWRLSEPACGEDWQRIQHYVCERLNADDCATRTQQISYRPCLTQYYEFHIQEGPAINAKEVLSQIEAEPKHTPDRPQKKVVELKVVGNEPSPIERFNAEHSLESLLTRYGYKPMGNRWLHPDSTSGEPGVSITDKGRYLSSHGCDPLADEHSHDAFDLFCQWEHDGDRKAAIDAIKLKPGQTAQATHQTEPQGQEWGIPESILDTDQAKPFPFPLSALPRSISAAVQDVQQHVKSPVPMIVASALTSLSVVAQGHLNVKRDHVLVSPVSLFFMLLAESGERKSATDRYFIDPLREAEKRLLAKAGEAVKSYRASVSSWEAKKKGLCRRIEVLESGRPDPEGFDSHTLSEMLEKHEQHYPPSPPTPRIILSNETAANLTHSLAQKWPSAALVTSEGGLILGGHAMGADQSDGYMATINDCWGGGTETRMGRKSDDIDINLSGTRLSASLQIQPGILYRWLNKAGAGARNLGFLARFMVCHPDSTQGNRPYSPPGEMPALKRYTDRLVNLLEMPLPIDPETRRLNPRPVSLSLGAFEVWRDFHDDTERELAGDGQWTAVRDYASKAAEQVARMACLLDVAEDGLDISEVSENSMASAVAVVSWFLTEAARVMGRPVKPSQVNAEKLLGWMVNQAREAGTQTHTRTDILQLSPVRGSKQLTETLDLLADKNWVRLQKRGRGTTVILNPLALEEQKTA